jgi:glycine/D-amino acid oxidase-like deaminating enzyme
MPIDVLIVGQGLAGSLLAWLLIQQGYRVMVVDDGAENASQVAAGLINPITGRRLLKSPEVDTCLPAAKGLYLQLQQQFQQPFFVELPMLRVLNSPQQRDYAEQRQTQSAYQAYLKLGFVSCEQINAAFGLLQQQQTGYLKTRALLAVIKGYLQTSNSYRCSNFSYQDLQLEPDLQWQDLSPKQIVFCEGHQARFNPWFGKLPFQPAKGEILTGQVAENCPEQIINYGHWLLPLGAGQFKTGASFETRQLDNLPTQAAKQTLLNSLKTVYPNVANIQIIAHQAGIRATTLDKQPLIGSHPQHRQLHIFNGFGAKGSLAIPLYAQQFINYLKQQQPLPLGCDIGRYYDTHFPR